MRWRNDILINPKSISCPFPPLRTTTTLSSRMIELGSTAHLSMNSKDKIIVVMVKFNDYLYIYTLANSLSMLLRIFDKVHFICCRNSNQNELESKWEWLYFSLCLACMWNRNIIWILRKSQAWFLEYWSIPVISWNWNRNKLFSNQINEWKPLIRISILELASIKYILI